MVSQWIQEEEKEMEELEEEEEEEKEEEEEEELVEVQGHKVRRWQLHFPLFRSCSELQQAG